MRGEVAAGAGVQRRLERDRHRERPHGLALALLLEADGEDPLVDPGLHELRGDDGGRPAHRAGGVHAEQRLAGGAEGVGEEQLRHHHALEEVGRLADDDGVDVGPRHLGVVEGAGRGLADEAGHRDVAAGGLVLGLADPDDGDPVLAHQPSPSRTVTRFCCRHGPEVAWATPRVAVAVHDPLGHLADAGEAGDHHRVGGQRAPGRVHVAVVAEAERLAEDQLLGAERRVQLGDVEGRRRRRPSRPRRPWSTPRW